MTILKNSTYPNSKLFFFSQKTIKKKHIITLKNQIVISSLNQNYEKSDIVTKLKKYNCNKIKTKIKFFWQNEQKLNCGKIQNLNVGIIKIIKELRIQN